MKPAKHTIETATQALKDKKIDDFLEVVSLNDLKVVLRDKIYGVYSVDIKTLSPKTSLPLHKTRARLIKFNDKVKKYLGVKINNCVVTKVFYGPDEGYKNRSFYFNYEAPCGHSGVDTLRTLQTSKKTFACGICSKVRHGERLRIEGVLKKRSPTYNYWLKIKKELPVKYQDFTVFKNELGEKPFKRAELILTGGTYEWRNLQILEDTETNLIASAIRQAFRHSSIYKNCLKSAEVQTEEGARFRCAVCLELFKKTHVQVDHITPIQPLSGAALKKEELIDRIWTDKIQVLDKGCHTKKSTLENKQRRENKKLISTSKLVKL